MAVLCGIRSAFDLAFDPPWTVLLAHAQADALRERLRQRPDALLVACYCAQWCRTCESYRRDFEALAQRLPQHVFVWIDVEDSPQLLGDDEVENFPTLLLERGRQTLFFGVQQPVIQHLETLIARSHKLPAAPQRRALAALL